VSGHLHVLAALSPGNPPPMTCFVGDLVGRGAGLDIGEKCLICAGNETVVHQ
jgi:hypothetical protein